MSKNPEQELRKIKKELALCESELKKLNKFNERLRASIGYDELEGWKPQVRLERQYGWVYSWLYPLDSFMNQNLNNPLTPDLRNKIQNIVTAIIAQLAVSGKYGVKLPHDPLEVDLNQFALKQKNILNKSYEPCDICGEDRITHECHIIPRSEGGPLNKYNFVILCPLHHHLFDHHRLSKAEWDSLSSSIIGKSEAAIVYANEVRLPILQSFWNTG